MTTTTANPSAERRKRIEAERARRPEAEVWLGLLARALDASELPAWTRLAPRLPSVRDREAPLLHDAFVAVDGRAARRWVRGLLKAAAASAEPGAASLAGLRGRNLDPLELLAAAAGEDAAAVEAIAARGGADPLALTAVARLAALPLLHGCAAALAPKLPAGWARGWCPVCGGWPSLAELRGLERARVLRCGRCATGWELPLLVCPFCDEHDHDNQFSFAADGEEQKRRVDVCQTCHGYIKTLTTLSPLHAWAVPLEDLATVELDIVAAERELRRPDALGFDTDVRVVAADGRAPRP